MALPAATKERARVPATMAGAEPIARHSNVTQAIATTGALPAATKERARVLATLVGAEAIARLLASVLCQVELVGRNARLYTMGRHIVLLPKTHAQMVKRAL